MMTFSEVIEAKGAYNVFPITDTPLNTLITNWYSSRVIGCENADDFIRFFKRVYNRDYRAYYQMLRLDPRVTDYDWLVQTYRERQKTNDVAVNGSRSETHIDNKAYDTVESTDTTTGGTNTRTLNTRDSNIVSRTGSDSTQVSQSTSSQRDTDTNYTRTSEGAQETTGTGENDTLTNSNSSGLSKSTPMSVSYTSNGAVDREQISVGNNSVTTDTVNGLNFTYADGQTLASVKGGTYNATETHETTSNSDNIVDETIVQDSTNGSLETNTDGSFENSETGNLTHTGTITDALSNTGSVEKSTEGTVTDTISVSGTNGSKSEALEREIWTGRDKEVAELLARACTYIAQTDAFSWLCDKLDVCFYGIYEG